MRFRRGLGAGLAAGLVLATASHAFAEPGAGTFDDPIRVDAFPYAFAGTTADVPSERIDSYSCAPATDESGPEQLYRFELGASARVTAWVQGDGGPVDIDVHLLTDLTLDGSTAASCAARGNVIAEAELAAGEHFVVVDSFEGAAQAGPYVLHLEAIGDAWIERTVADGVRWRARRFTDWAGAQVVHELVVDTSASGVELLALDATGCETVGTMGAAAGAVAGINGGYFDTGGGCPPVSLLKSAGVLIAPNAVTRGAFGLGSSAEPLIDIVTAGQDWPAAREAHGGGPVLAVDTVAYAGSSAWADQGFSSAGFIGPNPRTVAGYDSSGRIHLLTVDGRHENAAGMAFDDLAAFAVSTELGMSDAVNLDGGGSTTLWIAGVTPNGVVNYPSDAGPETSTHSGSRACSGGFFVFAPPYNFPPRFQTDPVIDAQAGVPYRYDADALDLDVTDTLTFSLTASPAGMVVDASSGVVDFEPTSESPPSVSVTLRVSDDEGAYAEQSFTVAIEGATGAGGSGGGPIGPGGSGGAGATASGGAGPIGFPAAGADESGGCDCRIEAPAPANRSGAWAWLALAIAVRRRRARGAGPDGGIETTIRPSEHVMLDVSVPKLLDEAP